MKRTDLTRYKMFGGKVTILQLMVAIGIAALTVTIIATIVLR